jgi:predicted GIY-YIG superfamily endonuclease
MLSVDVTVRFEWKVIGYIRLGEGDRLVFPKASSRAGLYRFEIERAQGRAAYIGETDQLDRRFQHYRTPGPSQRTNLRLNALMLEALKAGDAISVAIMTEGAVITLDGREREAHLLEKSERVLLEQAAIYAARDAAIPILNV